MADIIRVLAPADFGVIKTLIPNTFAELFTRESGHRQTLPPRTAAELGSYLDADPEGCLIAERDGKITGSVFAHTWGDVGWIGPLVVHPAYQGRGIGKKLLAAGTEYLRRAQARTIGLETMPQTVYNLGLYLKRGYLPGNLRLRYGKAMTPDGTPPLPVLGPAAVAGVLPAVRRISDAIEPGLDYSKEFVLTYKYGLGKAILWLEGGEVAGFCLFHYLSARGRALVKVMAASPARSHPATFASFLAGCEQSLLQQGISYLIIPVYGEYSMACRALLEAGYTINNAGVRLFLQQKELPPADRSRFIHLSQWSG